MDAGGNLMRIGDNFTPDAKDTYTWHDWTLPATVADADGKIDIYVKNTSGCHIYDIEATIADSGTNAIASPVTHHPSPNTQQPSPSTQQPSPIYNLNGQRTTTAKKGIYIMGGKKYVNP